jgi:photosynthesis system II assembly factor YCF48-like protein
MNEVPIRLLREALQARVPERPSDECLDAETVAAWADDTLGRDERRAAEAHAADCERCQALVAAMAKTAPPAAARSWWRAPVIGWLVPLTGVAAALLVWMNMPGTPPAPSSTSVARAIEQQLPTPPQYAQSNARADTPTQGNPNKGNVPPPARQDAAKVSGDRQPSAARNRVQSSAADTFKNEAPAPLAKGLSEAVSDAAAPAAPAALVAIPASPATPAAAPQPAQQAAAETVTVTKAATPPVTVQRTASGALGSANARALMLDARPSATLIVSSNASSRWRILANGAVQHSTDGGSTWEMQSTGVTVTLAAGVSPAASICWLVGPEGIVLLSTDGRTWRRLAFPETANLTSVRATDDKRATVYRSDGRAFSTTDGGQTWTR